MNFGDVLTAILLALGVFFSLTGGVGVLRMPDFYTRAHCAGKGDTLGQFLILVGLAVAARWEHPGATVRLFLIILFIFITSPTATHALCRAAQLDGVEPWREGEPRR